MSETSPPPGSESKGPSEASSGSSSPSARARRHFRVTGVVQGVGFRPFVHRLASELELAGFVGNDSGGVFIEVEGPGEVLDRFARRLEEEAPPAARIASVSVQPREVRGPDAGGAADGGAGRPLEVEPEGFSIVESRSFEAVRTLVSPDLSICEDCAREIADPGDRRYGYAFTNCTNCGPRYTIIRGTPYDRPATTMAVFRMCARCQSEYDDPADRRFHAQPNACPECGPRLVRRMSEGEGSTIGENEPGDLGVVRAMVDDLAGGAVLALKGLGGFHLACDATNAEAVARLRARKGRPGKPLALMVPDVDAARALCELDEAALTLLESSERPIVLAPWKAGARLDGIAPGNAHVGVMLPYTPLHRLLLDAWARVPREGAEGAPSDEGAASVRGAAAVGGATAPGAAPRGTPAPGAAPRGATAPGAAPPIALVMTSANRSGEPIVKDEAQAEAVFREVADVIVSHDREILIRADDSVMTSMVGGPVPVRRSRGYAPFPIELPVEVPPTLGIGGELKSTFCFASGRLGFLSPHVGDMENLETLRAFEEAVDHFQTLFGVEPERVVCDSHPGYLSSGWARKRWPNRIEEAQHHHAHVASLMAEHGYDGSSPLLGVAFDGTGYGADGAVWGGEILDVDYRTARRVAHLAYARLPGGDAAVRRPYRHALALLEAAGIPWERDLPPVGMCRPSEEQVVAHQIRTGLASPWTSSMGRLFDGVAALLGLCEEVTHEGEAAIRLEALAREGEEDDRYAFGLVASGGEQPVRIDPAPLIRGLVRDLRAGVAPATMALAFHRALARVTAEVCVPLAGGEGFGDGGVSEEASTLPEPRSVGLTGGVFQNQTLTELTVAAFGEAGIPVLVHRIVPPNDGGLALGQVLVGV